MKWQVTHDASWLTVAMDSGIGTQWLHWTVRPSSLLPGHYVDTIMVMPLGAAPMFYFDSVEVRITQSQYVSVRRAWRPGERDSTVAAIMANGLLGQFSDLADSILAKDSTSEVAVNPLWHPAASNFPNVVMGPTSAGMTPVGIDLHQVDGTHSPGVATDTLNWLMLFWYNTTATYHGYVVIYSTASTSGAITLNTTTWDNSGARTGGGGGEVKPSTGEYWSATGGTFQVTSNSARTAGGSTITSGPFTGGTERFGLMGGRLVNVVLTRVLPSPSVPANQTVNYDFRGSTITAARFECTFKNPGPACT